ncbi:MAG: hypothetical protein GXP48_12625 [Acidobacteria bacterium]|nr:hypothetical protein [Acidobacteriota bacterium]
MKRTAILLLAAAATMMPIVAFAQLAPSWMIPAAANTPGLRGTYWRTDVNLHNPHEYDLPVVVQFLPSGQANWSADVIYVTLKPWETVNLWDVLGPKLFDWSGTGALLIYADTDQVDCSSQGSCDFLATSRTYTPDPFNPGGEFGQAFPGVSVDDGLSWDTYAYTTGVMNDGTTFRANAGVASWTDAWVTVQMDVQDAGGDILRSETFDVPPFGMVQRRIRTAVDAGTVVFSLVDGPDDSLVFPYATVVNQLTGDPTYLPTRVSAVGVTIAAIHRAHAGPRPVPMIRSVRPLDRGALHKRGARAPRAASKGR